MRRSLTLRALGAALVFSATTAQAQIVGTFNSVGSATFSGTPTNVAVSFAPPITAAVPTLDGIFAVIAPFSIGSIANVTVGSGASAIPSFITLSGFSFSLTNLAAGSFSSAACGAAAAAGQTCSLAGSGMNWSNVDNGSGGINSAAAFNFSGLVTTPGAQTYSYTGIFTQQFVGQSYQQVLAGLGGGSQIAPPSSYSLNIQAVASTVPEPATVALMATGLVAVAGVARRRRPMA